MADVRALLAAERQARRISHPHLSYTKSGMLVCTVCNLNVKSEALWEGHLKSANHRRNTVQAASQENAGGANIGANAGNKGVKRKIEDVDDDEAPLERDEAEIDARKKPKSRPESIAVVEDEGEDRRQAGVLPPQLEEHAGREAKQSTPLAPAADDAPPPPNGSAQPPTLDEDEWAAFEREVAPLAAAAQPDYTSATITAAPVTSAQLKAQEEEDRRRKLETEADDEKEDEERRIEEEFDVMEEMEERVRKLREKRDALRSGVKAGTDMGQENNSISADTAGQDAAESRAETLEDDGEEEDEEEEEDEWYS
ncbi:uncharacterized protein Z520_11657 [Fonsecaea multimorphosa CBS 102226]|uniref:Uncharacterized protein n=1 Tax=Fonsecaea multimorphosa CBS 102226 TaxID=1442371 RepID=A0A0D2K8F6_9EURO|nr:uncharacterized protein Z520_11657 [Fonsecaea multimorphosa CBS 102226]KIX92628.1 hypothetical protein Z520_11657 [Fonsecaea multimorphosa CBS 102226]OAL17851.1 hypothetical protein AYO22_11195 [Fonsecaea multimorphosa]